VSDDSKLTVEPLNKTTVHTVTVEFGDCDPAGIVFFPNYLRWMDAASHHHFQQCGLPPWRAIPELPGCVGAPMLEINTRFLQSASQGDRLELHSTVEEWRGKVFIQVHRVMRGDTLICEGRETRALCLKDATGRLKAVEVPEFIRSACAAD
jgi:4-hydroxybenzoyl-CoA thioesterase